MTVSSDASGANLVQFDHDFFRTNGDGCFRMDETGRRPVYEINLGDQTGVMPLRAIKKIIETGDNPADHEMLDKVAEALRYVSDIRVGDALPAEIVDGGASWTPAARHATTANQRIVASMVSWSGGSDDEPVNTRDLRRFMTEQVDRVKISRALQMLEEAVGEDDEGPDDIQSALVTLTNELSYIEALREKMQRIKRIGKILTYLRNAGGGQANDASEVAAVMRVFNHMMLKLEERLAPVDAELSDISHAVRDHEHVCELMQQVRNDLWFELMPFDAILEKWDSVSPKSTDMSELTAMVGDLYRFLAPVYSPVDEWTRLDQIHNGDQAADAAAGNINEGAGLELSKAL